MALASKALEPSIVVAEDTTLTENETGRRMEEKRGLASYETPDNDRRAVEKSRKETEGRVELSEEELKARQGHGFGEHRGGNQKEDAVSDTSYGNGRQEDEEEGEEEEMTQERLQSLLQDINLEGGLEEVEMTEEGVKAILEQVRQAEKDLCSVAGWKSETSAGIAELEAPGHETEPVEGRWEGLSFQFYC